MKRTLRVLSILALVAILFASCENNAETPKEKTAKDYLFGNSIISTVDVTLQVTDVEGNVLEGDAPEGVLECFMNFSFDENGVVSINEDGYDIYDFEGTVDGMSYRVSFTTEMDLAVVLDDPYENLYVQESELTFTVLDESTVKITGVGRTEAGVLRQIIRYDGTAPIFYAAPKWAVENDYVVSFDDGMMNIFSMDKMDFVSMVKEHEDLFHDGSGSKGVSLSSKLGDNSYEVTTIVTDGYEVVSKETLTYHLEKKADGAIEFSGKFVSSEETENGVPNIIIEEILPATEAKLVPPVPEWARSIYRLDDDADMNIPVSSDSINMYSGGGDILSFDRTVEENAFTITMLFPEEGDNYKEVIRIEKTETEGEYKYSYKGYLVNEDGTEELEFEVEGIGKPKKAFVIT